jgi:mediator of RNA polymerase II transcription subunit 12
VLTLIAEPLRAEVSLLPPLECRIQEEFFEAISNKFKDIESLLVSGEGDSMTRGRSEIAHTTIFLSRLLQFDLGFRGAWTPVTKSASANLSSTIFHLAVVCRF